MFVIRAKELLEQGNTFNYDNFSSKSQYGYPYVIKSQYILWKNMIESFIVDVFGDKSIIYKNFLQCNKFHIIGNAADNFYNSHNILIACLESAITELKFKEDVKVNNEELVEQNNKVFIVHGHDEVMKDQLLILLNELGLEPIVLHRQADQGSSTIIEKFERYSDVGYAFVLLTPDDFAYSTSEESVQEEKRTKEYRARQNVVFELGYFFAKLGRRRVTCLYKHGVTVPSDISGIITKEVVNNVEEKAREIMKELKGIGYQINI
jgi:predicted nucleotide-binding protein